MSVWEDELAAVLGNYPKRDLSHCGVITRDVEKLMRERGVQGQPAEQLELILRSLLGDPDEEDGFLLAAGWLLDMRPLPRTAALASRDTQGLAPRAPRLAGSLSAQLERNTVSVRRHIAFWCLKSRTARWASGGSNEPRTLFAESAPRTRTVASKLATALRDSLKKPTFEASSHFKPETEPLANQNSHIFARAVASWDQPSKHYPTHLKPSVLARAMTASAAPLDGGTGRLGTHAHLYGAERTFGGEPISKVIKFENRVILRGNPGGGKSTVLMAAVTDRISDGAPAIFVRFTDLLNTVDDHSTSRRDAGLKRLVDVALKPFAGKQVRRQIAEEMAVDENALIALDGLDEVAAADEDTARAVLRDLYEFTGSIIISSRWTAQIHIPGEWKQLSLDSLKTDQAKQFLHEWFGAGNVEGLDRSLAVVDGDSYRDSALTEIPVLLGIVAVVASVQEVHNTKAGLYQQYVMMFFDQHWKQSQRRRPVEVQQSDLSKANLIAWLMATGLTGSPVNSVWTDTITIREMHEAGAMDSAALQLINHYGLLVPHGASPAAALQHYRWIHRTIHEHMVGSYLATTIDIHSTHLGLDPELLMGGSHWIEPLKHLIGLLQPPVQDAMIRTVLDLARSGDPGWTIHNLAFELAAATPLGSGARRAAAQADDISLFSLWRLDDESIRDRLLDCLRRGDVEDLPTHLPPGRAAEMSADEGYVRQLVANQRAAPRRSSYWVDCAAEWLSLYDPDTALAFLVESSLHARDNLPFPEWHKTPSRDAVRSALAGITQMSADARLNYLTFLSNIGAFFDERDIARYNIPQIDLAAARCANYKLQGRWMIATPSKWPPQVAAAILGGDYGTHRAFMAVFNHQESIPSELYLCPAAMLAFDVLDLCADGDRSQFGMYDSASLRLLAQVTSDSLRDAAHARKVVQAMTSVRYADRPAPLDWCFAAHRALDRCSILSSNLNASYSVTRGRLSEAVDEIILRHDVQEIVDQILMTKPREWIFDDGSNASFSFLGRMRDRNIMTPAQIAELVAWGAPERLPLPMHFLPGQHAQYVVEEAWLRIPGAFTAYFSVFANALAQRGALWGWRDRLVVAERNWFELHGGVHSQAQTRA